MVTEQLYYRISKCERTTFCIQNYTEGRKTFQAYLLCYSKLEFNCYAKQNKRTPIIRPIELRVYM